ncbi:MAG: OadG family protein [Peptococcaceae bacterium]|nr:OadG family protein [Peptococcaceae bacterium]
METGLYALKITIMGMGTTFIILSLLALVMQCFAAVFNRTPAAPVAEAAKETPSPPDGDRDELVAVIAAAAHYAATRWKRAVLVKSVVPVWNDKGSPWADAGRRELMLSGTYLRRAQ